MKISQTSSLLWLKGFRPSRHVRMCTCQLPNGAHMGHKMMQNIHKQSKTSLSHSERVSYEISTLRADFVDVTTISKTATALPRLQADSPFNGPVPTERELLSSDLADDPTLQECREALEEPGLSVGCRPG